jgi:DNA-binding NarL/FixJ family response regulator
MAYQTDRSKASNNMIRVMIVDDHPLMRSGLTTIINTEQDMMVIAEASSAREATQLLKTQQPDILVMDLTLEDFGGLELIPQIRALYRDIPILVLSMHEEGLYAERALRAGARGYIMKREGADKLISAIRTVVQSKVWVSTSMSEKMLGRFVKGDLGSMTDPLSLLSNRELEVYELIGRGLVTRDIADRMCVSIKTVESHRDHIKRKLRLASGAELVQHAMQWILHEGTKAAGRGT